MGFIQLIEFTTTQPGEIEVLTAEWRAATEGQRTALRESFTMDRDRPNTYVQVVEFPSYEAAMANSNLPTTAEFARRLAAACDGPILFRNLDVRSAEEL